MRPLSLLLLALCCPGAERTVTTLADDGPGSLRQALVARGGSLAVGFAPQLAGKTIVLASPIEVQADAVIDGGRGGMVISGGGRTRLFRLSIDHGSWRAPVSATLRRLTLCDGAAQGADDLAGAGGAVQVLGGSALVLEDCTLRGNRAAHGGGAVRAAWRSRVSATGCVFEGNDGSANGTELGSGAIAIGSEGVLNVRGCTFRGNRGTNGGAIGSMLGELTVEDSLFEGNAAVAKAGTTNHGGAIYTDGASAKTDDEVGGLIAVRRCRFIANTAARQGGGAFLWGYKADRIAVADCWFERNHATAESGLDGLGGGIRFGNADWSLSGSSFDRNLAARQGGALWIGEQGGGSIAGCVLSGNQAGGDAPRDAGQGGALMAVGSGPLSLSQCTFADNTAHGGALAFGGQRLALQRCLLLAGGSGNGQHIQGVVLADGGGNLVGKGLTLPGVDAGAFRGELSPFIARDGAVALRLPAPTVAAGAQPPPPPAKPAAVRAAPRPPAEVRPPPQPLAGSEVPFLEALRRRVQDAVAAGRGPAFELRSGRSSMAARVLAMAGDELELLVGPAAEGMRLSASWKRLSAGDRASLARNLAAGPADGPGHALIAYWSLAAGDVEAGRQALALAGIAAADVRAAFTWPER